MTSFMHLFESDDFTPELTGVDDDGSEYRIMKVGGGTLGDAYGDGESWLVEIIRDYGKGTVTQFEVTTGMPKTHWDVLLMVIEDGSADDD